MAAIALLAACSTGEPARPLGEVALEVGPAPLRRLSNEEYTYALADLFPNVQVEAPELPRDLAVAGFENAAEAQQPSDVRIARVEEIAELYAAAVTRDSKAVSAFVRCSDGENAACATAFIAREGRRIFRRPLIAEEQTRFAASFAAWQTAVDFAGAVRLTLSTMLQSPQFLYRLEPRLPIDATHATRLVEPHAMATRLSFLLWASVPDEALLAAAERNELATDDQVRQQVDRMLADKRALRVYWSFHRQWLGLERILQDEHLVRTPEVDPGWKSETQRAAQKETELFVEHILAEGGTVKDLLTSRRAWVNAEMARLYGVPAPGDPRRWVEATLPEGERAGLLTRVSFLAAYSHRGATSPPVRANGIALRLTCRTPLTPPPDADLSQPSAKPGQGPQTNRMLFEARTDPSKCRVCHESLNGLGFGLENYNAAGIYETSQNGLAIDATGHFAGSKGDIPFVGAVELSNLLANDESVHRCAAEQWFRFAFGRPAEGEEVRFVQELAARFGENGGDVQAMLRDLATSPSFRFSQEPFQ